MELFHIEHKKYVGGRDSVLSEVGMLPAYLMGINILQLRKNILAHFKSKDFLSESSIKLATLLHKNKLKNLIFINYIPELNHFLYWCQQLIGESLGKNGKGFLPVISPAPKDHHSLLQLYLDGPKDKLFYVFSTKMKKTTKLNGKIFNHKLNYLNKKSLQEIKESQKNAFLNVLKSKKIPYREFDLPEISECVLGELFAYFILETAVVGKLLRVNPFNQPAVEQVKVNTKKLLV